MKCKCLVFLFFVATVFCAEPQVIGIAGASGAGKTTLARKLKNALGEKVTLLSQDSYYKDLSHLTREERARFNFDDPDSLDF
ncbi:MAG: AAA family ATPase, partial [Chlamydiia bacterium]|nr:AAA family ATPase [Chlamydiia bacterium]